MDGRKSLFLSLQQFEEVSIVIRELRVEGKLLDKDVVRKSFFLLTKLLDHNLER